MHFSKHHLKREKHHDIVPCTLTPEEFTKEFLDKYEYGYAMAITKSGNVITFSAGNEDAVAYNCDYFLFKDFHENIHDTGLEYDLISIFHNGTEWAASLSLQDFSHGYTQKELEDKFGDKLIETEPVYNDEGEIENEEDPIIDNFSVTWSALVEKYKEFDPVYQALERNVKFNATDEDLSEEVLQ